MKIIDLLNRIAKGELEDLTLVHFCKNNCLTKYHKTDNRFEFMDKGDWNNYFHLIDIEELNEEVAIIENLEEVEDKEYEDIQELKNKRFTRNQKQIAGKINQLIRNQQKIINQLENK